MRSANSDRTTPRKCEKRLCINAVSRGFWSVWLQVFRDDAEMRSSLIKWFPGTAADCFDSRGRPIPRAGGLV